MKTISFALLLTLVISVPAFAADTGVRGACENDVKSLCSGVERGGGRIKQCIKEHHDQLSAPCKQALMEKHNANRARRHGAAESEVPVDSAK